jgi:hypothetical protein
MEESTKVTITEIENLINAANNNVAEIRQVPYDSVVEVINRTITASAALSTKEAKRFAVRKAFTNFVSLAANGKPENGTAEHADLLPIAHPDSQARHHFSLEELRNLRAEWFAADPRISERARPVVASALSAAEGDIKQLHSATRLRVLVAAGEVPVDVANADTNTAPGDTNGDSEAEANLRKMVDNYYASRYNFLGILSNQVSLNTGANLYDHDGELSHMVERGDSREDIKQYLLKNVYFQGKMEDNDKTVPEEDFYGTYSQQQFGMFYDALNQLIDPPFKPDFREEAAERLAENYDWDGSIGEAIKQGASSAQVLALLQEQPHWVENQSDFETRGDVEQPTDAQLAHWGKFNQTYLAIKDIDAQKESTVTASAFVEDVLPSLDELIATL